MLAGCTISKSHHIRGVSPSFGNKKFGTRETGDRRPSSMICNRVWHPFHGFQLPFIFLRGVPHPTLPRGVLHRLAMGMSPVSRALNSARLRLAKFQFGEQIGASSKMLLMFLLLTKSLGQVCSFAGLRPNLLVSAPEKV